MPLYVDPQGNDDCSGSAERPFATLAHAVTVSREIGETHILLRGGSYFDVQVTLEARDSGLTIEAAPGERPVLHGGRPVTGWAADGERFLAAPLPAVREGAWDFRLLQVNGEMRPRACLPETDRFTHESDFDVRWLSASEGGWQRKPTMEELTTLRYRPGDLGPWLDVKNAELTIFHLWDESLVGIQSLDDATRTIIFSNPAGHPPGAFVQPTNRHPRTYLVWNVREGLTRPGQWYLDRSAGKLVYWPLPGESAETLTAIAPTTESIIRLAGTEEHPLKELTLRGITLAVTNLPLVAGGFGAANYAGALEGAHCVDCYFEALTLRNVGGQGIRLRQSAKLTFDDCEIGPAGAGCIIGRFSELTITDCHFHHTGLLAPSAIAVYVTGAENVITHCDFHDTSYSAIDVIGRDIRIEKNRLERVMQVMQDGGAIYTINGQRVIIRGNIVRGEVAPGQPPRLSHAYYLDEQSEDCLVEGNLAVNTGWPSLNHMGRRNTIRRNVFADEGTMIVAVCNYEERGITFAENIFAAQHGILLRTSPNAIAAMPHNLFYAGQGTVEGEVLVHRGYEGDGPVPLAMRDGSVIADPGFVDWAHGDFRLSSNSPARALGISDPNVDDAGKRQIPLIAPDIDA